MIRAAVITDEITQDFEQALDVMLEYGVRDAELRGLWGTNLVDLQPAELQRAWEALRERGMQVCGIASPLYKCHLFPAESKGAQGPLHLAVDRTLEDQLPLLERAIELARYFDTNLIRIFAFWRGPDLTDEVVEQIAEGLKPGVRRAEDAGIVLGLENEHACTLGTAVETVRVLEMIDSPSLKAIWDPGNAFAAGELPFPDGYEAIKHWVVHVHVKDAVTGPDGKKAWTVVGEGEIDYRGQVAALRADGYQGLLSLETHYKPASGSTEEGSRECLAGLLSLLKTDTVPSA